jgi:hypothetical protein
MSEPTSPHAETERIDLAVDANGERYTERTFGMDGAPWRGATILTPGVVADLRERGLLPLRLVLPTGSTSEGGLA